MATALGKATQKPQLSGVSNLSLLRGLARGRNQANAGSVYTNRYVLDQGFTMMEAMITVAIIGILAAISYPSFTGHLNRQANRNTQQVLLIAAQDCSEAVVFGEEYTLPANVSGSCTPDGGELSMTNSQSGDTFTATVDAAGTLVSSF